MGKNEIINDNELLYLIREGNEQALEIMYKKYIPLMEGKLNKFNIETEFREDENQCRLNKVFKIKIDNHPFYKNFQYKCLLQVHTVES